MNCLRCNAEMFKGNLLGLDSPIYISNIRKGILDPPTITPASCYICPECGYTELYTDNAKALLK